MKKDVVVQLFSTFKQAKRTDTETGILACAGVAGTARLCQVGEFRQGCGEGENNMNSSGHNITDHFPDVRKMVDLGSNGKREISDIELTHHICYLIAQNGDPLKTQIAFAQTYFAAGWS